MKETSSEEDRKMGAVKSPPGGLVRNKSPPAARVNAPKSPKRTPGALSAAHFDFDLSSINEKDQRAMSREERKIAAIMKTFEKLEHDRMRAQQKREHGGQPTPRKNSERRNSGTGDADSSSGPSSAHVANTTTAKKKRKVSHRKLSGRSKRRTASGGHWQSNGGAGGGDVEAAANKPRMVDWSAKRGFVGGGEGEESNLDEDDLGAESSASRERSVSPDGHDASGQSKDVG